MYSICKFDKITGIMSAEPIPSEIATSPGYTPPFGYQLVPDHEGDLRTLEALRPAALALTMAKNQAMARLSTECQAAIDAGASSSALGSAHTYPTDKVSQLNLAGEVAAAILDGPAGAYAFMCADGTGVWDRRPHTDVQIKQVGQDVRAHVKTQLSHLDALRANVMAATTKSAINAVVW